VDYGSGEEVTSDEVENPYNKGRNQSRRRFALFNVSLSLIALLIVFPNGENNTMHITWVASEISSSRHPY